MNLDIPTNRGFYSAHLVGDGIEIGALDSPLRVAPGRARVRYVDCFATGDLERRFPGLTGIVPVDVVADADELAPIADGSLDFLIANHVVEHLVDPLGTLGLWRRKLRDGGILYMAVPDASLCPDRVRPVTSLAHLVDHARSAVRRTPDEHLIAFVWAWNPDFFADPPAIGDLLRHMWERGIAELGEVPDALVAPNRESLDRLLREHRDDNVHQHVFSFDSMTAALAHARGELGLRLRLIDLSLTKACLSEMILVLEATADAGDAASFVAPSAEAALERERFLEKWIGERGSPLRMLQRFVSEHGVAGAIAHVAREFRSIPAAVWRARLARGLGRE